MTRLQPLHSAGVSIWLDTRSRDLLDSGQPGRVGPTRDDGSEV